MLKSQEIALSQSKRREKMAEIQKNDEITDDARTELRSLTEAYQGAEIEFRAAVVLEGAERDAIKTTDKAETDFDRECRAFNLTAIVGAITDGKAITGREAEVSQELEQRSGGAHKGGVLLPWEALETRADSLTTTAAPEAGNLASRPVMSALERLFETSAAQRFGFKTVAVTGRPSWPEMQSGAAAHWVGEGQGTDAEPIITTSKSPSIHTATARYLLSRQSVKENPALESVLRRDLSELMRAAVDRAAFLGTGTNYEPAGLLVQLLAAGRVEAVEAKASYGQLLAAAVSIWESAKLSGVDKVKIAGAPILFQTLADDLVSGTAVSSLERLKSSLGMPTFSAQISETGARDGTGKGMSTVFVGAPEGHALIPTWGAVELIVDPYSESRTGKIALTMFTFVDILVQRLNTHFLALSGVQDRA